MCPDARKRWTHWTRVHEAVADAAGGRISWPIHFDPIRDALSETSTTTKQLHFDDGDGVDGRQMLTQRLPGLTAIMTDPK